MNNVRVWQGVSAVLVCVLLAVWWASARRSVVTFRVEHGAVFAVEGRQLWVYDGKSGTWLAYAPLP